MWVGCSPTNEGRPDLPGGLRLHRSTNNKTMEKTGIGLPMV